MVRTLLSAPSGTHLRMVTLLLFVSIVFVSCGEREGEDDGAQTHPLNEESVVIEQGEALERVGFSDLPEGIKMFYATRRDEAGERIVKVFFHSNLALEDIVSYFENQGIQPRGTREDRAFFYSAESSGDGPPVEINVNVERFDPGTGEQVQEQNLPDLLEQKDLDLTTEDFLIRVLHRKPR